MLFLYASHSYLSVTYQSPFPFLKHFSVVIKMLNKFQANLVKHDQTSDVLFVQCSNQNTSNLNCVLCRWLHYKHIHTQSSTFSSFPTGSNCWKISRSATESQDSLVNSQPWLIKKRFTREQYKEQTQSHGNTKHSLLR